MNKWWKSGGGISRPWKRVSVHTVASKPKEKSAVFARLKSRKLLGTLALGFVALCAAGAVALLAMFWWVGRDMPNPNALIDRTVSQSTKIYDRTGETLLYEVHGGERRTLISFADIPPHVVNALVSSEDDGFYEHFGIDIKGIIRSIVIDVLTLSKQQGASTITQQLVKNAILSSEKSYGRKVREILLSLRIEARFTKQEILQMYFNEVPFGSTNYGIEAAAQSYYGKHAKDLGVAEGATLVAMVKAPTRYLNNPDRLRERRNAVLDSMVVDGYLAQDEADTAKSVETPIEPRSQNTLAPHVALYVKQKLEEQYGTQMVEEGGLVVRTTLDAELQKTAQDAAAKAVADNGKEQGFSNMAIMAIDPATGQIRAWVGGHDYADTENGGAINMAIRTRQPGSSIKPIVYSALFEKGYTPNTVLYDVETDFPTPIGTYHPLNANKKEYGPVSVRKALQGSLNIPAVKAMYLVGIEPFFQFAERFGYTTFKDRSKFGLSAAIGGAEVTLLEHTSAYATLAARGVRRAPAVIASIQDASGKVLYEWQPPKEEKAVAPEVVDVLSDVLSDDASRGYIFGTGSKLILKDRKVAAKTGTTNDYKDAWTMGYTPEMAVGVWAGNNNNKPMNRGFGGSTVASGSWNAVMAKAVEGKPATWYPAPNIPMRNNPAIDGLIGSEREVIVDRMSGKLATDQTPLSTRERRTYVTHHTILQYVNREDPLGAPLADPAKDPMYRTWEQGVQDWVRRQQATLGSVFRSEEPPTEIDDIHGLEWQPQVTIISPVSGQLLATREVRVDASVYASRRMGRVEVFMDSVLIGTMYGAPYQQVVSVPASVQGGMHALRVVAYDDVENMGEAQVQVSVPSENSGAWIRIADPVPQQRIERAATSSYRVGVELSDPVAYSRLELYALNRSASDTQARLVGIIPEPNGNAQAFPWELPEPGEYLLSVVAVPRDSMAASANSGGVIVRVE